MRVMISGSTGLIGTALVDALPHHGHEPVRLVRQTRPDGVAAVEWDPAAGVLPDDALDGIDAVVNLAGAGIGDKRWSPSRKALIMDSRVDSTTLLAKAIAAAASPPDVFLSGSAIGHYGSRGDEVLTEDSSPGSGFLADVVHAWEQASGGVAEPPTRTVNLRTGIVLSGEGGTLAPMLLPFKLGIGGRIGNGRQWMSWIAIDDVVAAIIWLLEHDVRGPVNLTAPNPVTNAEFTKTLGRVLRRPTVLPLPKPALWARLGREATAELAYGSQRVMPERLTAGGYEFAAPTLEGALRRVLGRD